MGLIKLLAALAMIAAVAAFVTKPDAQAAEKVLKQQLMSALAKEEIKPNAGGASTVALIGCKLNPQACYDLVRRGIRTTYDDRTLYARFDLEGFGKEAVCYGAFTQFFCPGGLRDK